jgi:glycosyltransferase involved in cell wall biosynthesis
MLSIVIPTYNEEDYLPLLLTSIKGQTFQDYEIIVADNKSTDNTVKVATSFGACVVPGGLPGKGRNIGASYARGDTILFLDADVVLQDPELLQKAFEEFNLKKFAVATCGVEPLSDKKLDKLSHEAYNLFVKATASFVPHAPGFCIFVKRSTHDLINGFDEEIKLAEDSDYVYRASRWGKFGVLNQKVPVSVRRLDRDGRMKIILKYILCGIHMRLFGQVKSDIFNYTFGYPKKTQTKDNHT